MAFSDARNDKARAETGRNATNHGGGGSRSNRPSGPNQVASYGSLTPNGNVPATGIFGGLGLLGKSVYDGDAYGTYGEPDRPPHDISTRDDVGFGSLRGNTGGRDAMAMMAGPGASGMDPMRQKVMQTLMGMNPAWANVFKAHGLMPAPAAPQGLQAAPPPAPGSAQSPGLKFKPMVSPTRFIGDQTPGLKPYGYNSTPYRFFG
jgi:hypothetical protein